MFVCVRVVGFVFVHRSTPPTDDPAPEPIDRGRVAAIERALRRPVDVCVVDSVESVLPRICWEYMRRIPGAEPDRVGVKPRFRTFANMCGVHSVEGSFRLRSRPSRPLGPATGHHLKIRTFSPSAPNMFRRSQQCCMCVSAAQHASSCSITELTEAMYGTSFGGGGDTSVSYSTDAGCV